MKKNTRFIAFLTVIFFVTAAVCFGGGGTDTSGSSVNSAPSVESGSSGSAPLPAARGKLTITGIPSSLNGKYAMLSAGTIGQNDVLVGFEGSTGSGANANLTLSRIANGRVSIPVYLSRNSGNLTAYQGNDTAETLMIAVLNDSTISQSSAANIVNYLAIMTVTSVTFSGGNRELVWNGMLLR